ncbi:MAG: TIGR03618 family F420-dependent PPOX class oxidoreductase, partial [Chloroflexota bacterium]|nr:TIGR03618 family F420-dependent PPOX class oxidoreductase [Chloroflexota bacterium]
PGVGKLNRGEHMEFEDARPFMETNHRGVISTLQRNGAVQTSIVVCGAHEGKAAFVSVRGNSAKVRNLRRNRQCTVLSVSDDWRGCVAVEGQAQLFDLRNTPAEELRVLLRAVFQACGDKDHPDWEEYDRAMVEQDAVVVLVPPDRVYGRIPAGR